MPLLDELIAADLDCLVEIRHDLHAHPELGYQEVRTSGVVRRELEAAGVEFVGGLAGGTGILGYLPGTSESSHTVALRADMDALPIIENTGRSYASTHDGVMHACGHDGHTTVLLGTARTLAKLRHRPNNVLFIFQPAEEFGGGGSRMCDDGVLSGKVLGKPADIIFGLHGTNRHTVGEVATRLGAMMASSDPFVVNITGKGGHAAMPHTGTDPVVVASHFVVAVQTIASRNVDPLDSVVVTVAQVSAGNTHNVIPDTAHLKCTLRALNAETREYAQGRIREIAAGVAEAFGAKIEVDFLPGYPVTVNHPLAVERFKRVAGEAFGPKLMPDILPVMGAEDFSFYGKHVPACFYWLGLVPDGQDSYPNLHAPEFDFNDDAIPVGVKAMCSLALSDVS
jgi:amidohydrolase